MGHETNHIVHQVAHIYQHVELFGKGEKAKELSDIIKQHALAATGIAFIPVPGADLAAMVANTWTMYVRINNAVGVSFGENALKSIASGIAGNLAAAMPAIALGLAAESVLKFIPGLGTIGGIAIGAATNVAVMYVAGKVYLKALEVLLDNGRPLTEENLKMAARDVTQDKAFVKEAYAEGKATAKKA
jgi:uncharacterized protein (DUF697 family)